MTGTVEERSVREWGQGGHSRPVYLSLNQVVKLKLLFKMSETCNDFHEMNHVVNMYVKEPRCTVIIINRLHILFDREMEL